NPATSPVARAATTTTKVVRNRSARPMTTMATPMTSRLHIQDLLKLIGVAIVVIGLALRLRTTLVVVVAALATGLVAGLPLFSHEGFFQHLPYLTKPG